MITPISPCIRILGLRLTALLGEVAEPQGGEALVKKVGHWGQALSSSRSGLLPVFPQLSN